MTDTDEMIPVPRAKYDALVERLEELEDIAAFDRHHDDETIPFAMTERMLDGESPVKVWREYRELGLQDLAGVVGLSPIVLDDIEQGKHTLSLPEARAIASALKLGLDNLFLDVPAAPPKTESIDNA